MTNRKTTKKALIFSALSLLLCFSMLVGTTFAWFTDSVTSAGNIIQSGTLDVTMEWADGTEAVPAVDSADWIDAAAGAIFNYDKWEPGYTEVRHIKIANEGTLALKYVITIEPTGEVEELAEVIDVYFIDPAAQVANRTDLANVEPIGTLKDVIANVVELTSTTLLAGENDTVTIALKMQESAGNEYQNKKIGDSFAIKLLATQMTYEEDSFDNNYDGGAAWLGGIDTSWYDPTATEVTIGNAEQLAGLAAIVNGTAKSPITRLDTTATEDTLSDTFAGKTITLASDIDLKNIPWTPIGDPMSDGYVGFDGTFDGNGYTIYNLNINNSDPAAWGQGLFGYITKNVTIKNLNVHNATVKAADTSGVIAGYLGYNVCATFSNISVTGNVTVIGTSDAEESGHIGGIVGCGYYSTFDNCSVVANAGSSITSAGSFVGGIVGYQNANTMAITNCTVKNVAITGESSVGGIAGIIASGTTFANNTVENVVLTKTRIGSFPKIGALIGCYDGSKDTALANCSAKDVTLNGNYEAYAAYNVLYGAGYDAKATAKFDVTGVTASNITNNLVEVKAITDVAGLKDAMTNGGDNYILTKDIVVAKNETITLANGISAVIDLNGHKISGTADKTGNQELFLVKGNLTVKNGSMEYAASNNQGWSSMITIFDVTAGGVLNMEKITANVGGSDMNFIVHLNNWGSATLNVDDCDFTASYVAIRAFNSGYDMNTVTVKNTAFHNGRVFWVHNYTAEGKNDSTLTLDIYGNGNTTDNAKPVRFGFDNEIYYTIEGALIKSATSQAELNSALTGNTSVNLADGNYTMPGATNSNITINGSKDTVISVTTPAFHGSDVTFNGVTVKGSGYSTGVQHVDTVTYNNATIVGEMCLYGEKVVFNNCTFELAKGQYIWTYSAKEVEFNNCTFNTAGKAILVYNEGAGASKVTVKGCTFNATAGDKAGAIANQNCAAIEIDNYAGMAHTVITEGNTYSSNFSGEWRIKNFVAGNAITVNGTAYEQIAVDGKLMTIDASKNVTVND